MDKNNIIAFHHFNIKAQNFKTTVNFYQSLGFESVHSWSLPDFNITKCIMMYHHRANMYVEICDKDANMPTQGRSRLRTDEYVENALLHICFVVENATVAYEEAISMGAKGLSQSEEINLFDFRSNKSVKARNSLVFSPNGEVIEFLETDPFHQLLD